MVQLDYDELVEYVATWYQTDADTVIATINSYGVDAGSYEAVMELLPENSYYKAIYNADQTVRGYSISQNVASAAAQSSSNASQIANSINSNTQITQAASEYPTVNYPVNTSAIPVEGVVSESSPTLLTKVTSAANSALKFVTGEVLPAVAAAATGISLGKLIAPTVYNIAPDFWDALGIDQTSFDPATWNSITSGDDSFASRVFNTIFGLNPDTGETTMYLDTDAIAYLTQLLYDAGVFDPAEGDSNVISGDAWSQSQSWYQTVNLPIPVITSLTRIVGNDTFYYTFSTYLVPRSCSGNTVTFTAFSSNSTYVATLNGVPTTYNLTLYGNINGHPIYALNVSYNNVVGANSLPLYSLGSASYAQVGYVLLYGDLVEPTNIEGITDQPDATIPDFSSLPSSPTINDYMTIINNTYPNWADDEVTQEVVQPDGTTKTYHYYPVPYPNINMTTVPDAETYTDPDTDIEYLPLTDVIDRTSGEDIISKIQVYEDEETGLTYIPLADIITIPGTTTLAVPLTTTLTDPTIETWTDPDTGVEYVPLTDIMTIPTTTYIQPTSTIDEETDVTQDSDPINNSSPSTQTNPLIDSITTPPTGTGTTTDTGTGSSPDVVAVSGSASALWAVYNPTQAQLDSFGAWLWSPNFIDQLLKLFNDPMQSIIGIHKIFASPSISGTSTIVVGYLDSGVASKTVGAQYTTIDCGTVSLSEYYQNVYDYSPFTEVSIYLPFIGIHQLDVGDVMRSSISVVYHVDVITGACLAEVQVHRDGATAVLYQYSGNAAVTYPISSGSYMGVVASVASVAAATIGTIATGGGLAPLLASSAGAALNARTRVSHSGSFSGNAGAMGCKIPYLIVTRPQTAYAEGTETLTGIPASSIVTLGECSGFTKCLDADLSGVAATETELEQIREMLLSGVFV